MKNHLPAIALFGALGTSLLFSACSAESDASAGADMPAEVPATDAAAPAADAAASAGGQAPAKLARIDFDVAGMDCGGCVIGTRTALRKLDGVQTADASYDDATDRGTAWALYDPAKVTPERMMAAIRELGYTPTVAPSKVSTNQLPQATGESGYTAPLVEVKDRA